MDLTLYEIIVGVTLLGIIYLLRFYLPNYLIQKGKNLATKEDIEEVTQKVESIKHEYQKEREIVNIALQARNESIGNFSDKVEDAIQEMWDIVRDFRNKSGTELTQLDLLQSSEEYKQFFDKNIRHSKEIQEISVEKIGRETVQALNKLHPKRIWLGEDIWQKFNGYIMLVSTLRIKFISDLKDGKEIKLDKSDENLKSMIELTFEEEEYIIENLETYLRSANYLVNLVEQKILRATSNMISGNTTAEKTLEKAAKFEELRREMMDKKFT